MYRINKTQCVTHFIKWQHIFNLNHIWNDARLIEHITTSIFTIYFSTVCVCVCCVYMDARRTHCEIPFGLSLSPLYSLSLIELIWIVCVSSIFMKFSFFSFFLLWLWSFALTHIMKYILIIFSGTLYCFLYICLRCCRWLSIFQVTMNPAHSGALCSLKSLCWHTVKRQKYWLSIKTEWNEAYTHQTHAAAAAVITSISIFVRIVSYENFLWCFTQFREMRFRVAQFQIVLFSNFSASLRSISISKVQVCVCDHILCVIYWRIQF